MSNMTAIYSIMLNEVTNHSFSRLICNNNGEKPGLHGIYILSYHENFFKCPDTHECNNRLAYNLYINDIYSQIHMTEKLRILFSDLIYHSKMSTIKYKIFDTQFFSEITDELQMMCAVLPYFEYLINVQQLLDFSISRSFPPTIIDILVAEGGVLSHTHIQYMVQKTVNVTAIHQNGLNYILNQRDMDVAAYLISKGLRYNNRLLVVKSCFGTTLSESGVDNKLYISVMDYIRQCGHPKAKWFYELILKS